MHRWAAVFAIFCAKCAIAAPEVLVVQRLSQAEGAFNVPVAHKLGEELDVEGRVAPILWSMTDPVFRAYVEDGKLPKFVENPDDSTIRDYAGKLRVAYVLVVEAVAINGQVVPQANLYSGTRSRPMWSMVREDGRGVPRLVVIEDGKVDEERTKQIREKYAEVLGDGTMNSMTVYINGQPDWESTATTLARTWTRILAEGPFKDLEPQRRVQTPDPDPGLTFTGTGGPGKAADTALAMEQARLLASNGDTDKAILVLRDAIDADPFHAESRIRLAELLLERGFAATAAQECERAANVTDKPGALWAMAAEAWIVGGNVERAHNAASEALARGINTPQLQVTVGEVWLAKGEFGKAKEAFDRAVVASPSPRAYLGRSIANAVSGEIEAAIKDLDEAQGQIDLPLGLYRRAMGVFDSLIPLIADELKAVPMAVRVESGQVTTQRAQALQTQVAGLVELIVRIRVPERHSKSHGMRDLAFKLMSQSSVEVLEFARTKNEDTAMESALSLGEALKLIPSIFELFEFERKYDQKSG